MCTDGDASRRRASSPFRGVRGHAAAPISPTMSTIESHATDERHPPATNVELLMGYVSRLVGERQSLRASGAGRAVLECNRAEITRVQWQLSHALIARYSPAV